MKQRHKCELTPTGMHSNAMGGDWLGLGCCNYDASTHSTIQYVKPPVNIETPELAKTLATARMLSTAGKPVTAGPPATACSKGTAEMLTTPLVTPGTSAIAERPAIGNHQELKGCQQQQECLL